MVNKESRKNRIDIGQSSKGHANMAQFNTEKTRFYNRVFFMPKGGLYHAGNHFVRLVVSDYFYGNESEEFIYFKISRLLITDQKSKHVSTDAKLLCGMLLDRMGLSAKNDWYDDSGRVYIYYMYPF